jgi:hypothetical protein
MVVCLKLTLQQPNKDPFTDMTGDFGQVTTKQQQGGKHR